MKLELKYFRVTIIVVLGLASLFLPYLFLNSTTLSSGKSMIWMLFFGLLVVFTIVYLWYIILFRFQAIEITATDVRFRNIITKREKLIKAHIKKFKANLFLGKVIFLDENDNVIIQVNNSYYSNIQNVISDLHLVKK